MPYRGTGLRSKEVEEVMGRVPPTILRWSQAILSLILVILMAAVGLVEVPVTEKCGFLLTKADGNEPPVITVFIPPRLIESVIEGNRNVTLISEAFPSALGGVCRARIADIITDPLPDGTYVATARSESFDTLRIAVNIRGAASVTVGTTKLFRILWHGGREGISGGRAR